MGWKESLRRLGTEAAEDALCAMGLERRRTRVAGPLFGMLTVAALAGVAGMFLAPRSGRELVGDVIKRWKSGRKSFASWTKG